MTPEQSARWHAEMVATDRRWATAHRANPLPPERLLVLLRAVSGSQRDLELETANTRGCLARLVEAVTGRWRNGVDVGEQTVEALQQVHKVEQYLLSQQDEQGAA